jgi:hypothetical protein
MSRKKLGFPAKSAASPIVSDRSGESVAALQAGLQAATPSGQTLAGDSVQRTWRIYRVERRSDSVGYVGVTQRSLAQRLAVHDHAARLRPHLGRPGTLTAAIRQAYADGVSFDATFQAGILAETSCPAEARRLERDWIAKLGTARPRGFNVMPGGASLGGPANAQPVTLDHPVRGQLAYASLMDAVADIDRERRDQGKPPLHLGTVYARRAMAWSLAEALELMPHADGRRERIPFRWHGRTYDTLDALARAEGLPIATLRSRLHRARRAGCGADHDVAQDRRQPGAGRTGGIGCGRQAPILLPHPTDPTAPPLAAADFARLTGLPRATLLHRYHRLVDTPRDLATLSREAVLAAVMQAEDRRVAITLPVPGGQTLRGGVRAVIREVLADPALSLARPEQLGASAIRARLRRIPGWPEDLSPEAVLWAFGFKHDTDRNPVVPVAAPGDVAPPPDAVTAWRRWPSEQLWLWFDPTSAAVRGRMRAVLADALAGLPEVQAERLGVLADAGEPGAALRLLARLLLGQQAGACQMARDLSACALLLATLEYGDQRAAIEFARLARRCADPAITRHGGDRYPRPFDQPSLLRARMQRQARLALSRVRSTAGSAFKVNGPVWVK